MVTVQFTHAMIVGSTATPRASITLDALIAVLRVVRGDRCGQRRDADGASRTSTVRRGRLDAVLSDVAACHESVGERAFSIGAVASVASYGDVAEELFAELAEAVLIHAPHRMAKLVPVLPANVTLLAKIASDAIRADEREHALALYDRVLELPIPDEGEARTNYLRSLNNACIQAHAVKAYEAAARIADRAQLFAHENPYIYHAAACAYAAVGDLAKAFHQVKLANRARLRASREGRGRSRILGSLLEWPEFKALFRDWHARQEGN